MDEQGNPVILILSADLLLMGGARGSITNIPATAMPANINLYYQGAMIYFR
jgi:hypothetical protein